MLRTSLRLLITAYQYCCSPLLGARCRFYPSCSNYALHCLQHNKSITQALLKIMWRILRCQPFSRGGVDLP